MQTSQPQRIQPRPPAGHKIAAVTSDCTVKGASKSAERLKNSNRRPPARLPRGSRVSFHGASATSTSSAGVLVACQGWVSSGRQCARQGLACPRQQSVVAATALVGVSGHGGVGVRPRTVSITCCCSAPGTNNLMCAEWFFKAMLHWPPALCASSRRTAEVWPTFVGAARQRGQKAPRQQRGQSPSIATSRANVNVACLIDVA